MCLCGSVQNVSAHTSRSPLAEEQHGKAEGNCALVVPVDVHSPRRCPGFGQAMADGVFGCGLFQMKVEKSLFRLSQLAMEMLLFRSALIYIQSYGKMKKGPYPSVTNPSLLKFLLSNRSYYDSSFFNTVFSFRTRYCFTQNTL